MGQSKGGDFVPHRKMGLHPTAALRKMLAEAGPGGGMKMETVCGVARRKVPRTSRLCRDVVSKEGADVVCRAPRVAVEDAGASQGQRWTTLDPADPRTPSPLTQPAKSFSVDTPSPRADVEVPSRVEGPGSPTAWRSESRGTASPPWALSQRRWADVLGLTSLRHQVRHTWLNIRRPEPAVLC